MTKLLFVLFIVFSINAQEKKASEIVNPAGKWFFGAEIGPNIITSYNFNEPNKSMQGGILAEFYTGRHWSLTGRVKYFETGLSYIKQGYSNGSGFLSFGSSGNAIFYQGAIVTVPVNIKWEFRIHKNFSGNLNLGANYNFEIESNYYYSREADYSKYNSKEYFSYNSGIGFNYFISNKRAVFINIESYIGGVRGNTESLIFSSPINNTNILVNFGYKYNFKL